MARKITDEDLANRGVMGLPDVPGLTAIEMQKKLEEIPREVIIPRYNELVDSVTSICDEFSKLNSYAVGDYCIYQNKLYKCNTATSGDWDASKWTETSVGDELKSVNSNLKPITSMIEITVTKGECTLPQSVLKDYNGNYICISQPNVVGTTPCVRYNSLKAKYATQKGSSDYSLTFDWNGSINIFVTIIKIK